MMTSLLGLPEEIIQGIVGHLHPKELLKLCSTCHVLQENDRIRDDPVYWRSWVQSTFRFPNAPTIARDGRHWKNVYRRMLKTRVMFWGNNDGGAAGSMRSNPTDNEQPNQIDALTYLDEPIADLQCGGWSTTVLTSAGQIYGIGRFALTRPREGAAMVRLEFGEGVDMNNPKYRIQQFSQRRDGVVGLSDAGQIWYWDGFGAGLTATCVQFAGAETAKAQKVVVGWHTNSALLKDHGLYIWRTLQRGRNDKAPDICVLADSFWVLPTVQRLVPASCMGQPFSRDPESRHDLVNWVLLQDWVVYLTAAGRVYAAKLPEEFDIPLDPFELTDDESTCLTDPAQSIIDIQGAHKDFALFTIDGKVLLSNADRLEAVSTQRTFRAIPCLQHTGVIQLAFGDWHFHALHKDGSITSFGHEPQSCGALGLGGLKLRGVRSVARQGHHHFNSPDRVLLDTCYSIGRRVVFEPEKQAWLAGVYEDAFKRADEDSVDTNEDWASKRAEWVEHRLRCWNERPPVARFLQKQEEECEQFVGGPADDGMPAYFPLSVSAAGWHSAAVVVINETKAERERARFQVGRDPRHNDPQLVHDPGTMIISKGRESWAFAREWFPVGVKDDGELSAAPGPQPVPWETPSYRYETLVSL